MNRDYKKMKWNVSRKHNKKAVKTFLSIAVISRSSFFNRCVIHLNNLITDWKFTQPNDVVLLSSFCSIVELRITSYRIKVFNNLYVKCLLRFSDRSEQIKQIL